MLAVELKAGRGTGNRFLVRHDLLLQFRRADEVPHCRLGHGQAVDNQGLASSLSQASSEFDRLPGAPNVGVWSSRQDPHEHDVQRWRCFRLRQYLLQQLSRVSIALEQNEGGHATLEGIRVSRPCLEYARKLSLCSLEVSDPPEQPSQLDAGRVLVGRRLEAPAQVFDRGVQIAPPSLELGPGPLDRESLPPIVLSLSELP